MKWIRQTLNKSSFATINVWKRNFKNADFVEIIIILLSRDLLIVCNPNACLPIQMQDPAKAKVRSDNIYSPPTPPHTHGRKATASLHVGMQMWSWWGQKCDDGRDWVGNIQRGGRKLLGHLIRHCRSRMSSEAPKQGHTKRINPTISTKSECAYKPFRH